MIILLGITGSIAAYKTPEIIRQLKKTKIDSSTVSQFKVQPIITRNATHFVTPLTLSTVAETEVSIEHSDTFYSESHLELARSADILVIAPATANFIAKAANGIADDLLTTVFLAYQGPKLIVPAMHEEMFDNPLTQQNIQTLKSHDVDFLGPVSGDLACGDKGRGRMVDPDIIVSNIEAILLNHKQQSAHKAKLNLLNKKILITSGGTRERIDPVRMITNSSTGKLGSKLANHAAFLGAEVTLVSTVPVPNNPKIKSVIQVDSVAEMKKVLDQHIDQQDALFMAAAVSDYTTEVSTKKRRRENNESLKLTPTPDLLATLGEKKEKSQKGKRVYVGFSLVDEYDESSAREKLSKKKVDYLIVNTPDAIGSEKRDVTIVSKDKSIHPKTKQALNLSELSHELLSLI